MGLWITLALLLGVAACLQGATNGALGGRLGVAAAVALNAAVVFVAALAAYFLLPRAPLPSPGPPWWLWLGGVYGLIILAVAAVVFPRLGAGPTVALMVTAQLATALVLDHFGWFGARLPVTPLRLLGVLLLFAGAVLVLWPRLRT
jgi:transporter family-2 protein